MKPALAVVAAAFVGSLGPVAAAESLPYGYYGDPVPPAPKDPWKRARFEGAVGALIGGQSVGFVHGFSGGLHLDAGLRRDRAYLYGEYDFLSVGQDSYDTPDPIRGVMHRFGGNLRYSLGTLGGGGGHNGFAIRGDFWAEAGAGFQRIGWNEGGRLGRKDLAFGFGGQATFKIGSDHPRFLGVYYAMKVTVASAPPIKDESPTCAGPCDEPTGPSPYDTGIFFNLGVPFGR